MQQSTHKDVVRQIVKFGKRISIKKLFIRIDAPLSRQPLVKGERLVRDEVSAAIHIKAPLEYYNARVVR